MRDNGGRRLPPAQTSTHKDHTHTRASVEREIYVQTFYYFPERTRPTGDG